MVAQFLTDRVDAVASALLWRLRVPLVFAQRVVRANGYYPTQTELAQQVQG